MSQGDSNGRRRRVFLLPVPISDTVPKILAFYLQLLKTVLKSLEERNRTGGNPLRAPNGN